MVAGSSSLLFVCDSKSGRRFLVDSGAEVSVAPFKSSKPPVSTLRAADGRPVPCWGQVKLPVCISGIDYGQQQFLRAGVN